MPNYFNGAGRSAVFDVKAPGYADLSLGYEYTVVLANTTGADITAGTITFQEATRSDADPCVPNDDWADAMVQPQCDAPLGSVAGKAEIVLSAQNPIPAGGQCSVFIPCAGPFLRANGVPTGVTAIAVITRLTGTAMLGVSQPNVSLAAVQRQQLEAQQRAQVEQQPAQEPQPA